MLNQKYTCSALLTFLLVFISALAFAQDNSSLSSASESGQLVFTNLDLEAEAPGGETTPPESESGISTTAEVPPATPAPDKPAAETNPEESQYYLPPTTRKSETIVGKSSAEMGDLLAQPIFQQLVTLDFKDADLQNVVRLIAKKTNINIIMTKDIVKGTVTVHLENVPLGVALDTILKSNNLGYILEPGNIVRIVPRRMVQMKPDVELETKWFSINWVPVEDLRKTLERLRSPHGKIWDHKESNSIVVTDIPPNIRVFEDLVKKLDQPQRQVLIEARIANIDVSAMRELGIKWTAITQGEFYRIQPPVPKDGNLDNVTDWWVRRTFPIPTAPGGNNNPSPNNPKATKQTTTEGIIPYVDNIANIMKNVDGMTFHLGKVTSIFGEEVAIDAILSALEERSEAIVLASPKVVTLNNVQAKIDITTKWPYIERTITGGVVTESVKFNDEGITLYVTPYITENGYVRMTLEPSQKILTGFQSGIAIITERKATTNVIVKDEETVCLGGLRQHSNKGGRSGLPWLASVPVLGWLFKDTSDNFSKSELVIFVTPHIIKQHQKLNEKEQYQYNWIDNVWNLPDEMFEDYPVLTKDYLEIEKKTYPNKITEEKLKKKEKKEEKENKEENKEELKKD